MISSQSTAPPFSVVTGGQVQQVLQGREIDVAALVEQAYRSHAAGNSVNPPSCFLRFADRPNSRIIALPASLGEHPEPDGPPATDGIKWISSFPDNVTSGLPRASAVLILNDHDTGYPYACLEASIISATRTAALAAVAADRLSRHRGRPRTVGFVGTGLIARYLHTFLRGTGWDFDRIGVHDLSQAHAEAFRGYLQRSETAPVATYGSAEELITASDLVIFATIAAEPHVKDLTLFAHHPLVLHVSLRDLAPEIILESINVVDDVEHCLKADTSPHLAEQLTGNRDFVAGTLDDVIAGQLRPAGDRTVIFSPFGLGVLDLAVARYVYDRLTATGDLTTIDDFFHELRRYG
jgi:2,3-diaminopropionate biosynthesis protein SbnB